MYKSLLKAKDVEGIIFELEPKVLSKEVPMEAVAAGKMRKNFALNELVAQNTGLSQLQHRAEEELVENKVLEKLKTIEEKAYAEAYKLGVENGKKKAFDDYSAKIEESLASLTSLIGQLEEFKKEMFIENEEFIVKMIYHIASKVIFKAIEEDKSSITAVLSKTLEETQGDEEIFIRMCQEDYDFLQTISDPKKRPWENRKKLKIEVSEGMSRGSCLIETNYGVIDGTIDQRVKRAWESLASRIPKPDKQS